MSIMERFISLLFLLFSNQSSWEMMSLTYFVMKGLMRGSLVLQVTRAIFVAAMVEVCGFVNIQWSTVFYIGIGYKFATVDSVGPSISLQPTQGSIRADAQPTYLLEVRIWIS